VYILVSELSLGLGDHACKVVWGATLEIPMGVFRQYQLLTTVVKNGILEWAHMHVCQIRILGKDDISFHAYHVHTISVTNLVYEKIYENLLLCVLYAYMYDYLCSPSSVSLCWCFGLAYGSRFWIWQRLIIL